MSGKSGGAGGMVVIVGAAVDDDDDDAYGSVDDGGPALYPWYRFFSMMDGCSGGREVTAVEKC